MIEARLTRAYERLGVRYLWLIIGLAYAATLLLVVPAVVVVPAWFHAMTFGQYLEAVAIVDGLTAVVLAWSTFSARRQLRVLQQWHRDGRDPGGAAVALESAQAAIPRAALGAFWGIVIVQMPGAVLMILIVTHRLSVADAAAEVLGVALSIAYAGVLLWFWLELAIRAGIEDIRHLAPEANRISDRRTSLAAKLFVGIVSVAAVSASLGGTFGSKVGAGGGAQLRSESIAVGVGILVMATSAIMLALSILEPIRDLTRASTAVRRGELDVDAQVAVGSTDELGGLAESFNEMVDGLRERQALRDHNAELVDELRASRERIVTTADSERRRIEQDLHDGAQQHLVLLGLKLGISQRQVDPASAAAATLAELRADLDHALSELRDLAHGIYPLALENEGLPGALHEAAQRSAIPTTLECDGAGRYRPELEAAVYFCCLEALQNAAKHAGHGAHATVRLTQQEATLRFEISDNGLGFDRAAAIRSAGVQNMTDRIGALGGTLRIESTPGQGTKIIGKLPVSS